MNTLTYCQCSFCQALGCRKTKDFVLGVFCKLCKGPMRSITANEYDRKLHYTATPHEEGLLPERCPVPSPSVACEESSTSEQETNLPEKQEERR